MLGTKESPGLTPRVIEELYGLTKSMHSYCEINISVYMIELYVDFIYDVLGQAKDIRKTAVNHLEIKEDASGMVYLPNVTKVRTNNPEELWKVIK